MTIGNFISIVVLIISLIISFKIIIKFVKTKNKFIRIVLSMFTIVLITGIMTFFTVSVENLLFKFDTAESAFRFNHTEEIVDVVEGESSCMVIYKKNKNTISTYYLYKSDTSYKMPNVFSVKTVKNMLNTNISLRIQKVIGTDDFYISGLSTLSESSNYISNNENDSFGKCVLVSDINNVKTYCIYDYIGDYETDDYYLIINGEKINVKEEIITQK